MNKIRISHPEILKILTAAAPLAFFAPALATGKVLFWGTPAMQFIPWKYLAFESLKAGNLPLWNPFNGMGAPLLANYQLAFFYPPNWLGLLFEAAGGISWLVWGETLMMALHLSWAAIGMMAFQKKMGVSLTGQIISGLAFGMSGYLVARVGFFSIVIASTWLPWVMFSATNLVEYTTTIHDRRGFLKAYLLFLGCAAMQLLTGHAQITFYTFMLATCWIIFFTIRSRGFTSFKRTLPVYFSGIILAFLMASIQLIPTMEYLLDSQRSANVDYSIAMVYSFWPWRFLTLVFPNFFGNPGMGNYWGYANFWEDAVYIGILPLAGAVSSLGLLKKAAIHKSWDNKADSISFHWTVVVIGFLLALGWNTPIFPFLYQNVPTFDMFNGPARFLIWVEFGLAVLAGTGIEKWQRPKGQALRWTRLAVAGSAAVSLGAFLSQFILKGVNATFIPAAALAGALGAITAVLALIIPSVTNATGQKFWLAAIFLAAAGDLYLAGMKMTPFINADFYQQARSSADFASLNEDERIFLDEESEYKIKFDRFFTFKSHFVQEDWTNLWTVNLPNTNILTGRQMLNNFDPLLPSRFVRLNHFLETLNKNQLTEVLGFLSVTKWQTNEQSLPTRIVFTEIDAEDRYRLYSCARYAENSEEAWNLFTEMVSGEGGKFAHQVIIENGSSGPSGLCQDSFDGQARLVDHQLTTMTIEIEANSGSWLEIAETWYPGWTATIDGSKTMVYPSNYIFKALFVPEGKHVVKMEYKPFSFFCGAIITSISSLIAIGLFFLSHRQGIENAPNKK